MAINVTDERKGNLLIIGENYENGPCRSRPALAAGTVSGLVVVAGMTNGQSFVDRMKG